MPGPAGRQPPLSGARRRRPEPCPPGTRGRRGQARPSRSPPAPVGSSGSPADQCRHGVAVERQPVVRPAGELADVTAPDGQAGRRLPVWLPAGAQFEGTARQAVPEHPSAHGGQRADARAADATVRPNDASDISTAVARDAGSSRIGAVASLRLRLPPPCASLYRATARNRRPAASSDRQRRHRLRGDEGDFRGWLIGILHLDEFAGLAHAHVHGQRVRVRCRPGQCERRGRPLRHPVGCNTRIGTYLDGASVTPPSSTDLGVTAH